MTRRCTPLAPRSVYAESGGHEWPARTFMSGGEWLFDPEPGHRVAAVEACGQNLHPVTLCGWSHRAFSLDHDVLVLPDVDVTRWRGQTPDIWVVLEPVGTTRQPGGKAYLPVRRNIEL